MSHRRRSLIEGQPVTDRSRVPSGLRRFCPDHHVRSVAEIDPLHLREAGIEAVLLDLDNTLVAWKGHEIPDSTREWVQKCKEAGLKLCLVSNTRNAPRLEALSQELDVPYVRAKMKPSRQGFMRALERLQVKPEHAVMVGDQLFTDVWGANRMGMRSIWVERIHPREFVGTRVSRMVERILLRWLRKAWEEG
ncbi:MAG: YqeG family HAD IIIA-type phosphatase [Armatimonadetes bacterium]|nr:MAG: YqeG family HAD IIIA-type phosphatase [Armatimonadota bacterium]